MVCSKCKSTGHNSRTCTMNDDCPICLHKIGDTNFTITQCGHKFCNPCLFKHMENHTTCPYCRQVFADKPRKEIIYKRRKLSFENFSKISGELLANFSPESPNQNQFHQESYQSLLNFIHDYPNSTQSELEERINYCINHIVYQYGIKLMDKLEIMDGPENFSELTEITNMIDFYRFRSTIQQDSIADDSDSNT